MAPAVDWRVAEVLVARGLLARESELAHVDVLLDGGSFRYLAAFWERVGALVRREDGAGWVDGVNSPEEEAEVVLRLAAEWVSAGAPVEWARKEAGSALRALRASGRAMPWGVT